MNMLILSMIMFITMMMSILFLIYFKKVKDYNQNFSSMYECGFSNMINSRFYFSMYMYSYLLMFLILDLEILLVSFMLFMNLNFLFSLMIFMFILMIILFNEWKSLLLDWNMI